MIQDPHATERQVSLAFDLIARYAEREGWIPIGWRQWAVGPWEITVNGTAEVRDGLSPYHARVAHRDIVALMIINPFGGGVGGWRHTELDFIRDMQRALEPPAPENASEQS